MFSTSICSFAVLAAFAETLEKRKSSSGAGEISDSLSANLRFGGLETAAGVGVVSGSGLNIVGVSTGSGLSLTGSGTGSGRVSAGRIMKLSLLLRVRGATLFMGGGGSSLSELCSAT